MGCQVVGAGDGTSTKEPALLVVDEVPSRLEAVRWAKGFGFSEGEKVLWLAHEGDTTWWTHVGVHDCPAWCNVLPESGTIGVATWSTTHVPFMRAIGGFEQWVASGYLERVDVDPGSRRFPLGGDAGLDEEMLLVSGADVLTSYPFGDPMTGVAERTGVPVMALAEYAESHPLGRAEFVKVFGWLTGRMPEARRVFDDLEEAYIEAWRMGSERAGREGRPVVFAGSSQGGKWTAPGNEGLVARLLHDAGGTYAFEESRVAALGLKRVGPNFEVEAEQCAVLARDCGAFGKVVHAPGGWTVSDARLEAPWFEFNERTVFHCNTFEVDYFGEAIMEPHEMLADLVHLFHPSSGQREFVYFQPTPP